VKGAVELRRQVYGDHHSEVALGLCHLAEVQWALGRREEGFESNRQCVETLRETLGDEHPEYATRLGALGVKLNWRGDIRDAVRTFEEVERIQVATLGDEHFHTAATRRNLARSLMSLDRHEEALPVLEAALSGWIAAMGDQDFFTGPTRMDIAATLAALGNTDRADSLAGFVLARYREIPPSGTALGEALAAYARLRAAAGDFDEAADTARAALAEYDTKSLPEDHIFRATAESDLGNYLMRLGDLASAEEFLLRALRAFEAQRGPASELALTARERLTQLYQAWDRPDEAARFAVEGR
jgi:tetratricopeptide (TPR) repeat protein